MPAWPADLMDDGVRANMGDTPWNLLRHHVGKVGGGPTKGKMNQGENGQGKNSMRGPAKRKASPTNGKVGDPIHNSIKYKVLQIIQL